MTVLREHQRSLCQLPSILRVEELQLFGCPPSPVKRWWLRSRVKKGSQRGWKSSAPRPGCLRRPLASREPWLIDVPISRFDTVAAAILNPEEALLWVEDAESVTSPQTLDAVREALERLPPREQDVLEEFLVLGRRQHEIASIHGVTQACISYLLSRAVVRLKWWLLWGMRFTASDWLKDCASLSGPPTRSTWRPDVLAHFWTTTSHVGVTRALPGYGQMKVRYSIQAMLGSHLPALIKEHGPESRWKMYLDAFTELQTNYIGCGEERKLPHWEASKAERAAKAMATRGKPYVAAADPRAHPYRPPPVTARPMTRQKPAAAR